MEYLSLTDSHLTPADPDVVDFHGMRKVVAREDEADSAEHLAGSYESVAGFMRNIISVETII